MTCSGREFASLTFKVAAEIWYEDQKPYWKKSTAASYRQYILRLNRSFAELNLCEISIDDLRLYQRLNSELRQNGRPRLVPSSINQDLNTLAKILSRAGVWSRIKPFYKKLPLRPWAPPQVLSQEEEDRFFAVASSSQEFSTAYWVSSLTNNTSARPSELRKLQLKHIDLNSDPPRLHVPSVRARNEFRSRVIPLNQTALRQLKRVLKRARKLGSRDPDHYLFPLRRRDGQYDPEQPASQWFIYKQWNKLIETALAQGAIARRIKPFDLRYNVVAKMLKTGASESTIKSIAGHIREQMLEQYSRQRVEAKTGVLNMLISEVKSKKSKGAENKKKSVSPKPRN
jgi:integrase